MTRRIAESGMEILGSLIKGPLYGYAIRKAVLERTEGDVDLTFGTLYEQIASLQRQGLIELERVELSPSSRTRKFYRITAKGAKSYEAQLKDLLSRATRLQALGAQG